MTRKSVGLALLVYTSGILAIFTILLFATEAATLSSIVIFGSAVIAGSAALSWYILRSIRQPFLGLARQTHSPSGEIFDEEVTSSNAKTHKQASSPDEIAASQSETWVAISHEERRATALLEHTVDAIVSIDVSGSILSANAATKSLFGYEIKDLIGKNVRMLAAGVDRQRHDHYIQHHLETGEKRIIGRPREVLGQRADGSSFPLDLSVAGVEVGGEKLFIGVMRDLTDRVALENQLQQAQKMEIVGQLTGGIAHDFNNLLAVVHGNLEMLGIDIAADAPLNREALLELCADGLYASRRGAELTRGLLAFSRKQNLKAESFDANESIDRMANLLRRTLGAGIDLKIIAKDGGWRAEADPSMLESALLNLAINASDAMGNVGMLTIETRDVVLDELYAVTHDKVEAGEYVLIVVSDNGPGMQEEVLERVLEPFFTTKEIGQGTGLGLSMVYGYAKQSRGHLSIYSEVDAGTAVKLYLPRSKKSSDENAKIKPAEINLAANEVILVVEDDPVVRMITVAMLKSMNFNVQEAESGMAALEILDQDYDIKLMLTDIVMPGDMSGIELAAMVTLGYPHIKIIYASGYSPEITGDALSGEMDFPLLKKPYKKQDLAQVLSQALSDPPDDARPA